MVAYVLSEVRVRDAEGFDRYRELAAAAIARFGGRYLIRGAAPAAVEGEWADDRRLVVLEFPSAEEMHEWYASPEYAEALEVSRTALERRLLFVEGTVEPS